MKKQNPNPLINRQATYLFDIKCKTMSKKVVLLFMFVMFITNISAQATLNEDAPVIREISSYINQGALMRSAKPGYSDSKNLEELVTQVQSSVYVKAGSVNSYGEKPKNLFTDLTSITQLGNLSIEKNNIEIIVISIDRSVDLNSTINLSMLSSFKKLKYVYFVSKVPVSAQSISSMITNYNEKYSIFYKVQNSDTDQ
ncbi:hypothetical protein [Flavobacterium sp.]